MPKKRKKRLKKALTSEARTARAFEKILARAWKRAAATWPKLGQRRNSST